MASANLVSISPSELWRGTNDIELNGVVSDSCVGQGESIKAQHTVEINTVSSAVALCSDKAEASRTHTQA
jgi:hypothetical protein